LQDYFGQEIALYFAWLGHLTSALWVPAAIGVLIAFFGGSFTSRDQQNPSQEHEQASLLSDLCFVTFALFNCLWSTVYLEAWKRRQAELAFKWGTYDELPADCGTLLTQSPRPGFKGEGQSQNPVTGRLEPTYPEWKQSLTRYGLSYPITAAVILVLFGTLFGLLRLQDAVDVQFRESVWTRWLAYLPMVVQAMLIMLADNWYRQVRIGK